ncbi:MAG: bifunctional [glutamate--ammonia ligase]-adenylyl-L-tyrosine phosphorylase/[glutamate--ammonia-ligase] adenylyltransferase [Myxococcales bacterium]|nr:bifunctional [glutamate--ammonia ligase]-adenylyl-L-tyrosine phosphorylase/[glutamate--ammonia-ligase] adenylyltransferase [Myxococcales bacterium]
MRHRLDALVAAGPDPQGAGPRLARYFDEGGPMPLTPEGEQLLVALFSSGSYLSDIVLSQPPWFAALARDPFLGQEKSDAQMAHELTVALAGTKDTAELHLRLRRFARREMLRLGAREIGGGSTMVVARELSALADACLDAAARFWDDQLKAGYGEPTSPEGPPGFVVLGLGKLGGHELNFSSDVDLCYFYSTDEGQAGRLSLHEYYTKLSQGITRAISQSSDDGFVFRVDLRLRPEGRSGPLCNSYWAAERYYETFGRTWERQALLRARPSGGNHALGWRLVEMLEPFVYPRTLGPSAIDDVRALRRLFREDADRGSFDVKLGTGGIRDVELVAQLLALIHGGQRPDLRERSTLPALRKLWVAGLLSDQEQRTLSAAYQRYRRIEHRVQLEHGAQTHALPAEEGQARLARRLGYPNISSFHQALARDRRAVSAIAETLGEPEGAPPAWVLRLFDSARDAPAVHAELRAAGFRDTEGAARALEQARTRMPPAWLQEACQAPDPDRALARFRDLATGGSPGVFTLLADHPQLLRMLASLFGTSDRLSRYLVTHPARWEPLLLGLGAPRPALHTFAAQLDERVRGLDDEEALREMRRFKTEHLLRVGLHDVAGTLAPAEVSEQLVAVAEACLLRCVRQVVAGMVPRRGMPDAELTVLGLGSVGAREMRYGSDLDLVFLYARPGTTGAGVDYGEWFARLAQRLLSALGAWMDEGKLYEVDTRLRPSGAQGLLVTSYEAFSAYHLAQAALWERAALLRARPLLTLHLPTDTVSNSFAPKLAAIVYGHPVESASLRREFVRMRARIENERAPGGGVHLRLSPGGLTDGEFLAAYAQLLFGSDHEALRTTNPQEALAAAHREALLPLEASLLDDYRFLQRVSLRARLLRDTDEDRLRAADLPLLARTLGMADEDALSSALAERMARMRHAFVKVLGQP